MRPDVVKWGMPLPSADPVPAPPEAAALGSAPFDVRLTTVRPMTLRPGPLTRRAWPSPMSVSRLRRAMRRAARAQGSGGLPGGLSVAQLEFLSALAETPGARPGQLARQLRLAPSSVATLVNSLARAQLIERSGGVDDRRTAVLRLTGTGETVVASWQRVNAHILTVALASLEPASRDTLALALPALRELTGAVDALADAQN